MSSIAVRRCALPIGGRIGRAGVLECSNRRHVLLRAHLRLQALRLVWPLPAPLPLRLPHNLHPETLLPPLLACRPSRRRHPCPALLG